MHNKIQYQGVSGLLQLAYDRREREMRGWLGRRETVIGVEAKKKVHAERW